MAQSGSPVVAWLDRLMIGAAFCLPSACDMRVDLGVEERVVPVEPDEPDQPDEPDDVGSGPVEPYKPNWAHGLRIELLWDTPAAIDLGDSGIIGEGFASGADLDLHLVHPHARLRPDGRDFDDDGQVDGWFDDTFDACWDEQRGLWGGPSLVDDPFLDRDDTDGGGPENLYLERPETDACYTLGVHVWNDWGYGSSEASVRLYWDTVEIYAPPPVRLFHGDLWDVASVCVTEGGLSISPSGCSADAHCKPKVIPRYPVPASFTHSSGD